MPKSARVGDIVVGSCVCHDCSITGIIITGSSSSKVNGRKSARIGDTVVGSCGCTGVICTGSKTMFVDNRAKARVGDTTTGCIVATIETGSPDVSVDG